MSKIQLYKRLSGLEKENEALREENAYLKRMMTVAGHTKTKLFKLDGYDHGITDAAFPIMVKEINKLSKEISEN